MTAKMSSELLFNGRVRDKLFQVTFTQQFIGIFLGIFEPCY